MKSSAARALDNVNAINIAPNSAMRENNFSANGLAANFILLFILSGEMTIQGGT
jgi:hypothetical protein